LAHFLGRGAAGGARTAQRRGHRRFADRMRLADGADKLALRILLVERAAVAKPALETVSHRALQTVNDHLGSVPWRANRIEHGRKPNVPQATRDMQCRKSRTDKVAIVAQAWDARTRRRRFPGVDLRNDDSRVGTGFGQYPAPRGHDEAVAIGTTSVGVKAALRGCNHKGAVLDRAGAQED